MGVAPPVGTVERFDRRYFEGFLRVEADAAPVKVLLRVNGSDVVATWAVPGKGRLGPGTIYRFRRFAGDLWPHLRLGDRVEVVVDGYPLPIVGHGMWFAPAEEGPHTLYDLLEKFAAGYVFNKYGALQLELNKDLDWQKDSFAAYEAVQAIVRDEYGLEAFATYGAVLGAIREGTFIGHDNDIDIGYISAHSDPAGVAEELRTICHGLIDRGYRVQCKRNHAVIRAPGNWWHRADIFPHFWDPEGVLRFPFGYAGTTDIRREDWQGTREVPLGIGRLSIPANAEQMLETLYGALWRQPNPGFNWNLDRRGRVAEAALSADDCERIWWESHWAHEPDREQSLFAGWLLRRDDVPHTVVDLGCGGGRDAFAFAESGRAVVAVDRSPRALARVRAGADERGLAIDTRACDLADADRVGELVRAAPGPVLCYVRFVLHALAEPVADALLAAIACELEPGDVLALEFRAALAQDETKPEVRHFRRYVDGGALATALSEVHGLELVHHEEGRSLAPYATLLPLHVEEDPRIVRILARRGPVT
ncbi:MAG: methyltransferase domain-containing protein [Sporichthyaceae bacterium]